MDIEIIQTDIFSEWLKNLRDQAARTRILGRMKRLEAGNPDDVAPVGKGVSEMRIDYGPGYRVYFVTRGFIVIVLLCGGNKSSQDKDIRRAKKIAKDLGEVQ